MTSGALELPGGPLAERILGRNDNHMAALGMSLHMRHLHPRVIGYI